MRNELRGDFRMQMLERWQGVCLMIESQLTVDIDLKGLSVVVKHESNIDIKDWLLVGVEFHQLGIDSSDVFVRRW